MSNASLAQRRRDAVAPAAKSTHPFYPVRAEGAYVWDADGNRYLDFSVGIAVMNVGHSHPKVIAAVREQAASFQHLCFAVAMHESYITLAERLNALAPGDSPKKTFLVNSGAEAVENAVKIARAYTGRAGIVAFTHAFHGRTYMAMSLTAKALPYKARFAPRASEIYRAPYPYVYRNPWGIDDEREVGERTFQALREQVRSTIGEQEVAAFIIEPVAGEGGFIPAPGVFLERLRDYADAIGALWIDDEVQSGMGRTGTLWAVDAFGLEPDLVTSAKALSSGFPLSAVIGKAAIMDAIGPGMLGSTFGGNPVSCAAALATLDVLEEEGLVARARAIGERTLERLGTLRRAFPQIGDVRGRGAMIGIEFVQPGSKEPDAAAVASVVRHARDHGLVLLPTGTYDNVIRLLPPLKLSDDELEEGLQILEEAVRATLEPVGSAA